MRPIVGRAGGLTPVDFGLPMGDQALLQGPNADAAARRNSAATRRSPALSGTHSGGASFVTPAVFVVAECFEVGDVEVVDALGKLRVVDRGERHRLRGVETPAGRFRPPPVERGAGARWRGIA